MDYITIRLIIISSFTFFIGGMCGWCLFGYLGIRKCNHRIKTISNIKYNVDSDKNIRSLAWWRGRN